MNLLTSIFSVYLSRKATAGSFVLYFEGYATASLSHDASEADVEDALSIVPVVQGVDVEFSIATSGACNSTAINVIQVSTHTNSRHPQMHAL